MNWQRMRSPWLLALASVLLGGLSFWWVERLGDQDPAQQLAAANQPDYYLEEMTRRIMNRDGALQSVLTAERVTHFPADDTTELSHPHMEIYNGGESPWQVVAERGIVKSDLKPYAAHRVTGWPFTILNWRMKSCSIR